LNQLLLEFCEPSTKLFRLNSLCKKISGDSFSDSFTRKTLFNFLKEYLRFIADRIIKYNTVSSILEYKNTLDPIFIEIGFVYGIFFEGKLFAESLLENFNKKSDTENLNFLYSLLNALSRGGECTELVYYVMEECLRPIISTVMMIAFREPDTTKLESNLKIKMSKNYDYEFVVENVPQVLKACIKDVLISAQNLLMLRKADPELYSSLVDWQSELKLVFTSKEAKEYLQSVNTGFELVISSVRNIIAKRRLKEDELRLLEFRKKLQRLQEMRQNILEEHEQHQRLKEIERFKKSQLNHFLEAQVFEQRRKKMLERQLEVEFERNILFENSLRDKEREKQDLLNQLKNIGANIDVEIEEMYEAAQKKKQVDHEKRISKLQLSSAKKQKEEENLEKMDEEHPYTIAEDIHESNEKEVSESDYNDQTEEDTNPQYQVNFQELRFSEATYKISNSYEEAILEYKTKIISEESDRLVDQLAFEVLEPPLEVIFDICVNRVVKKQAELTNSILMQLLHEKYMLTEVLLHYKKLFMGLRGDWADEFISSIFKSSFQVDKLGLLSIGSTFEQFEDPNLPDVKFMFERINHSAYDNIPILAAELDKYVTITSKIPSPLNYLMTDQITRIYFQQYSYLIKLRYYSKLLASLWKYLHDELPKLGIPNDLCRKLQFIRHSGHCFAVSLQEYIYHFVIEGAWLRLQSNIRTSKTFNNIFKHHTEYISFVQRHSFNNKRSEAIYSGIHGWMESISEFEMIVSLMVILVQENWVPLLR